MAFAKQMVYASQKGQGPLKKSQEMFYPTKKNLQDFQNQRYVGIFMSLRERERGGEREIERTKVQGISFLNRPGQNEKSAKY
jgi:hypothetical protein